MGCTDREQPLTVGLELGWGRASFKSFQYLKPSKIPVNKPFPMERQIFYGPRLTITGTVFAHFQNNAACKNRALATNGWITDRVLPTIVNTITLSNTPQPNLLFIHPNDILNRHLSCCGPLDCEGLENVWVRDEDGSMFGSVGDAISNKVGLPDQARCTKQTSWNGWWCPGMQHGQVYVKNQDEDAWDRYIMPLRFWKVPNGGGERQNSEYPITVNNPPDGQHPTEWPDFMRAPWFWPTLEVGATYEMDFGDYGPRKTYFHLRHCPAGGRITLGVWYQEMYTVQVWVGDTKVDTSETMPTPASSYGHNHYVMDTRRIWFTLECDAAQPVRIIQLPDIKVAVRLEVDVNTFYESVATSFIQNLALILGIDSSRIRIVEVQAGSLVVVTAISADDSAGGENYTAASATQDLQAVKQAVTTVFQDTPPETLSSSLGVQVSADSLMSVSDPPVLEVTSVSGCGDLNGCTSPTHGRCVAGGDDGQCKCKWGWWSADCSAYHCAHRDFCSGHGQCAGPNQCVCYPGWVGKSCNTEVPVNISKTLSAYGDLHLVTYDGTSYSFNSIGEFYLHQSSKVTLQARLEKCANGASCLTQLALQHRPGGGLVQSTILLQAPDVYTEEGRVRITVNGAKLNHTDSDIRAHLGGPDTGNYVQPPADLATFYTEVEFHDNAPSGESTALNKLSTFPEAPTEMLLSSGVSLRMSGKLYTLTVPEYGIVRVQCDLAGYLVLSVSVTQELLGTTHGGLYGVYNNNTVDDFKMKDGTVLSNPTPTQIHSTFGESWRLSSGDSYFEYGLKGKLDGYSQLNDKSFRPQIGANFTDQALEVAAITTCQRLGLSGFLYDNCLFDVSITGDLKFASASATAGVLMSCADDCVADPAPSCTDFCNVRGTCVNGTCVCDPGFSGDACESGSESSTLRPLIFPADEPINPNNFHWLFPKGPKAQLPECCSYSRRSRCKEFPLAEEMLTICQCSCRHPFTGKYCNYNPNTLAETLLGTVAEVPARSCRDIHYCRPDVTSGMDSLVYIQPSEEDSIRLVNCRSGGWTPFFNGTSGSSHVFGTFNGHSSVSVPGGFLNRLPGYVTMNTPFAAQCAGAMVRFYLSTDSLLYFQNGTVVQTGYLQLFHVKIEEGEPLFVPTHLYISNHGFALTRKDEPAKTFGSSHNGAGGSDTTYDYCNGVSGSGPFTLWYR
mmetsp:Transcript_147118/g.256944  ORF Transcript_147118/g.256944 Transcript_147118/m.256944 type:complete len:1181 (-) Transcript_147118:14-3556(-)